MVAGVTVYLVVFYKQCQAVSRPGVGITAAAAVLSTAAAVSGSLGVTPPNYLLTYLP